MKTNCINKIILFCIILLSAIENVMAQGHLISLSKLKNEIIYIYDFGIFKGEEYVYDRFMMEELRIINKVSFDDYAKRHPEMVNQEFYIYDDCKFPNSIIINKSDLDTINRENVHRLILIGQYCDSIDFSQLYFPNLQELHLIYNEAFPKHIEIYKNLQVLDVVSLFGEESMGDTYDSWKVTTLEKKGYRYPFIFPQEIYALKHLKILNFHLGGGFTYVTLSEQIGELRKLKALSMDGRTDNVVVPVSLLKKKRFNEDVMLSSPQKDRINFLSISRRKVSPYCIDNSFSKDVFRKSDISLHKQLFRSSYVRTYQNKSPMIKGNYKKNKPHGKWLLFYEDGTGNVGWGMDAGETGRGDFMRNEPPDGYAMRDGGYDDCIMHIAEGLVGRPDHYQAWRGPKSKCNCQDYCDKLRNKYNEIRDSNEVRCKCKLPLIVR